MIARHCLRIARSTSCGCALLLVCRLAVSGPSTLVSGRRSVALRLSVRLSCAYDLLKYKCRRNFKFIGHI